MGQISGRESPGSSVLQPPRQDREPTLPPEEAVVQGTERGSIGRRLGRDVREPGGPGSVSRPATRARAHHPLSSVKTAENRPLTRLCRSRSVPNAPRRKQGMAASILVGSAKRSSTTRRPIPRIVPAPASFKAKRLVREIVEGILPVESLDGLSGSSSGYRSGASSLRSRMRLETQWLDDPIRRKDRESGRSCQTSAT